MEGISIENKMQKKMINTTFAILTVIVRLTGSACFYY